MERTTLLRIENTNDYKYYAIKFLELPHKDINEIVCIPWMWIVLHRKRDLNVVVAYPVANPSDTEKRVKEREKHSKHWNLYKADVLYANDSYEDVKDFTTKKMNEINYKQNQCSKIRIGDHTSSASVEKTTHRSERGANSNQSIDNQPEFVESSKNDDSPALKRAKVIEPAKAFNKLNENHCSPTIENPSDSSVEPRIIASREFFTEFFTLLRDLQTTPARDAAMVDLLREALIQNAETMRKSSKLIDETRALLASSTITPEASASKDTSQPNVMRKSSKLIYETRASLASSTITPKASKKTSSQPKFILPPEYDENDSRWTLKHRELAPELVELMPHTNVYIKADRLIRCQKLARDCNHLARLLSSEIFTENALRVCSFTGERAVAYNVEGTAVRPGLDENARNALVTYVQDYGKNKGWKTVEAHCIRHSVYIKMHSMRTKY